MTGDPAARPTKTLIVGGGEVGAEVARRSSDVTIVELDTRRIAELRRQMPNVNIVEGPATDYRTLLRAGVKDAESVIIALGDDGTARAVVELVRHYKNVKTLVVVLQDYARGEEFQRLGVHGIVVRSRSTATSVVSMLRPSSRPFHEVVLTVGADAIGKRLGAIHLPKGTVVVAVGRGDRLMPPSEDLKLDVMDVLHVSAPMEELNKVRAVLLGDVKRLLPFAKILVPMQDMSYLGRELPEAIMVATFCMSGIVAAIPEGEDELVAEATSMAVSHGVPFHAIVGNGPWDSPLRNTLNEAAQLDLESLRPANEDDIVAVLKKERAQKGPGRLPMGQEVEVDLMVLRAGEGRGNTKATRRTTLPQRAADETVMPLLFARHSQPYGSMMLMLEPMPRSITVATLVLKIAVAFGGRLTVLTTVPKDHQDGKRMLRHINKTGDIYGIDVSILEIHGNPTLELLAEARSGVHDLSVVDRACKCVSWDILRRVYSQAPRSVLVV